jgi:ribosomal protein S1
LADKFPANMELKGTVNRLFDRGAIVNLGDGIEGFIPMSQLGIDEPQASERCVRGGRGVDHEGHASGRAEPSAHPEREGVAHGAG